MAIVPVQAYKHRKRQLITYARRNRKHMTPAEAALWPYLKSRQLGLRFRHQAPFPPHYIADFACHPRKLVIEIDGSSHDTKQDYDKTRSLWLQRKGYQVLRFTNQDVLERIDAVLQQIRVALGEGR